MSEMVHYKGKIKRLSYLGTLEQNFIKSCSEIQYEKYQKYIQINSMQGDDPDERVREFIKDFCSEEFVVLNGELYRLLEKNNIDFYEDIFNAQMHEDVIHYEVKYYNGGCGFSESLGRAIDSMGK